MLHTPQSLRLIARPYLFMGLAIGLAITMLMIYWLFVPGYGAGTDEASYFLAAKGLATHGDPAFHNPDPTVFAPENMVEARPGVFYPKYPIGYPLLCAAAYRLAGPAAAFFVSPIMLIAALVGVFLLARFFVNDLYALVLTFFFCLHPAMLYYGSTAWSHATDLAFCVWCLYFAWAWRRDPRWWKLAAAGVLLGYAVSIRYTEALLVLPIGWIVAVSWLDASSPKAAIRRSRVLLHTAYGALAFGAGIAPLLWYHTIAYGSPFRTGYSLTGESSAFSVSFFIAHVGVALGSLMRSADGLSVFLPLGLMGLGTAIWKDRRAGTFLALAALPNLLLYTGYYWTNVNTPLMYVRFFLPSFPPLIIASFVLLGHLAASRRLFAYTLAAATVGFSLFNLGSIPNQMQFEGTSLHDLAAVDLVKRTLPPGAVVMADGFTAYSLVYYTDMTIYYPRYFSASWVADCLAPPAPGTPPDFNPLRAQRFAEALGGRSTPEINALMCDSLLAQAKRGRTVGLLVEGDSKWPVILDAAFTKEVLGEDAESALKVYRLVPRSSVN